MAVTQERVSVPTPSRTGTGRADRSTPSEPADGGRILGLDGLRAVAILAVLIFHLRPATLPGGYLGVDIFFVISGFLITTLLLRELLSRGRLRLGAFWKRRARRLLPALAVVVVVATACALAVGDDLLVDARRQVIGAATFSTNWLEIAAGSSYFTHTAPQLFVNFWSLAVEEQFYLVWPLLLVVLIASTRSSAQRIAIVLGAAATSAILMAVLLSDGVTRVYYGTDTHAFGLMLGAALALSLASNHANLARSRRWWRGRIPAAVIAAVGLVWLLLTLDGESPVAHRGGILLATVLTAVIIAALATARGSRDPVVRTFETRPMVWLGQRSYGIYLWHWPVLLIVAAILPPALPDSAGSWIGRGVALLLTLVLAAASYRLVEMPVRRYGFRGAARRAAAAVRNGRGFRGARLVAGVAVLVTAAFVVALVVAPDKSQVEQQMEAAAAAVEAAKPTAEPTEAAEDTTAPAEGATTPTEEKTESSEENAPAVPMPVGDEISAFGDSMLYVAGPGLQDRFPGIALDAESNRQWPAVLEAIRAAVAKDTVREFVVIVAGTNAGLKDPAPLEEAVELLGSDRTIVVVNLYHGSSWIPESNENIAAVAAAHDNVYLADWYGTITENLDQLQPDGIHPDMDGMYLFADVVKAAFTTASKG